jgi:hypothetical protein
MRTYLTALALVCALASVAIADGKHHRFVGIHPVPKGHGGGLCHIEAHHVHLYAPVDVKVQYRVHDGWHHFVGDPVAYGWEGPKHSYYGHHPIEIHAVVGDDHEDTAYCYLEGPHYHAWAPPPGVQLELRGGAYWYVGDFPEAYATGRATYDPIDVVYQPIRYQRPAVTVEVAPPNWYGVAVVAAPPPVVVRRPPPVRAGVEVVVPAPSVRVEIAVPTVSIGIGAGVVVQGGHRHKHKRKHKHHGRKRGHDRDDDDD